jgi:hypothetical protein
MTAQCQMINFVMFYGVRRIVANVSERSVCSIFIGEWLRRVTAVEKTVMRDQFGIEESLGWGSSM